MIQDISDLLAKTIACNGVSSHPCDMELVTNKKECKEEITSLLNKGSCKNLINTIKELKNYKDIDVIIRDPRNSKNKIENIKKDIDKLLPECMEDIFNALMEKADIGGVGVSARINSLSSNSDVWSNINLCNEIRVFYNVNNLKPIGKKIVGTVIRNIGDLYRILGEWDRISYDIDKALKYYERLDEKITSIAETYGLQKPKNLDNILKGIISYLENKGIWEEDTFNDLINHLERLKQMNISFRNNVQLRKINDILNEAISSILNKLSPTNEKALSINDLKNLVETETNKMIENINNMLEKLKKVRSECAVNMKVKDIEDVKKLLSDNDVLNKIEMCIKEIASDPCMMYIYLESQSTSIDFESVVKYCKENHKMDEYEAYNKLKELCQKGVVKCLISLL